MPNTDTSVADRADRYTMQTGVYGNIYVLDHETGFRVGPEFPSVVQAKTAAARLNGRFGIGKDWRAHYEALRASEMGNA